MSARGSSALCVAGMLLGIATVPATAATGPRPSTAVVSEVGGHAGVRSARVCYEQLDNDSGVGIVSQNFEPDFDIYDDRAADDFAIAKTCRFSTVTIVGTYFNGSGPAESVNLAFHSPRVRGPGRVELRYRNAPYSDCGFGCLDVQVKGSLKGGTYWLSAQANQDFSTAGMWGWLTNDTVRGSGAMWKNPGDGFSTGCTTYTDLLTCIPSGEGGDLAFSIK